MRLRRPRDERVVGTSTPGDWCKPGTLYQWREGHPWYRITRVVPERPTRLLDGSLMAHWTVFGVPAPRPEREHLGDAVEYRAKSVLHIGDMGPGETRRVPLDASVGWREVVAPDPNPMPQFRLRSHGRMRA